MKATSWHGYAVLGVALYVLFSGVDIMVFGRSFRAGGEGEMNVAEMTISEVLKERTNALMSIQGVVGTGQGLCESRACIKVYVVKKTPELEEEIRRILKPYLFSIQESGHFRTR